MQCEMCGKEGELFAALVEGTELNVCKSCSSHGKTLRRVKPTQKKIKKSEKQKEPEKEIIQTIVENYAKLIKSAREKTGLSQKDFANKLNEKESIIHKLETGNLKPSINLARKLEKFCNIKLVKQIEIKPLKGKKAVSGEGLTIGDIIKIKK